METKKKRYDVGVAVGRWQVPDLHEAHRELIQTLIDNHDMVIIFVGLSPVFSTDNPLPYAARQQMLQEAFPGVTVAYIHDIPGDNKAWSAALDKQIASMTSHSQTVCLYGGRKSFIESYVGRYPTAEFEQTIWVSATEIRDRVKNIVKPTTDFRHGVIWGAYQRFPTVYGTVDIAVVKYDETDKPVELLLGKRNNEPAWRFPGGFLEPADLSIEHAAARELHEELPSIDVGGVSGLTYIGSSKVHDWRYPPGSQDQIMTHFYHGRYSFGAAEAGDDLDLAKWFKLSDLVTEEQIKATFMYGHVPLFNMLQKYLARTSK